MTIGDVKIIQSSISLAPTPDQTIASVETTSTNVSLIVMVVVIPLVVAALLIGVITYCIRKKRTSGDNSE